MRLQMQPWMRKYILEKEETPTEYMNRLVENMTTYYPLYGGFRTEGHYYNGQTGHSWINFTLKEKNKKALQKVRSYKDVYATRLRLLVLSDFYKDSIPQKYISYEEFLKSVFEAKIDLDLINEELDYEYESTNELGEFAKKCLNKRLLQRRESETFSQKFEPYKDPLTWEKLEGRNELRGVNNFSQCLHWAGKRRNDGFGFVMRESQKTNEHYEINYIQEIVRGDGVKTGVSLSFTSKDGGVLLEYPKVLEKDFTSKNGPVFEWEDQEIYALEGHPIPESWFWEPETIQKKDIFSTGNAELRRVLVDHIGLEEFSRMLELKTVDEGKYATLLQSKEDSNIYLIRVECTSTGRKYHLGFHPRLLPRRTEVTADAALAWTFGMTEEEYKPTVET